MELYDIGKMEGFTYTIFVLIQIKSIGDNNNNKMRSALWSFMT